MKKKLIMCENLKYGFNCECEQCLEFRELKRQEDLEEYFAERDEDYYIDVKEGK